MITASTQPPNPLTQFYTSSSILSHSLDTYPTQDSEVGSQWRQ